MCCLPHSGRALPHPWVVCPWQVPCFLARQATMQGQSLAAAFCHIAVPTHVLVLDAVALLGDGTVEHLSEREGQGATPCCRLAGCWSWGPRGCHGGMAGHVGLCARE